MRNAAEITEEPPSRVDGKVVEVGMSRTIQGRLDVLNSVALMSAVFSCAAVAVVRLFLAVGLQHHDMLLQQCVEPTIVRMFFQLSRLH